MNRNYNTRHHEAADEHDRRDWKAAAVALWHLLDDIDTADDVAKGDDAAYRRIAQRTQAKRFAIVGGEEIDRAREEAGVDDTPCEEIIRLSARSAQGDDTP